MLAQGPQDQERDRLFQSAVAQYESGHYADAVPPLEKLLHEVPESFEVHELLGLAYAAQSQDTKANEHLAKAVRIKPDSVAALSNLAASYARLGKFNLAIEQFTKAAGLAPTNFELITWASPCGRSTPRYSSTNSNWDSPSACVRLWSRRK